MALPGDVADALTALERVRCPLTQSGQVGSWRLRGDPSTVEADRIEALLGRRPAEPPERSQPAGDRKGHRCHHCGQPTDKPGVLG